MMLRLLDDLAAHARRAPDAPAAVSVGREPVEVLSRRELRDRSFQIDAVLRDRVPAGGSVILCGPNRPAYLVAFLGVLAGGRTLFPIASDAAGPELVGAAGRAGACAAIVDRQTLPPLADHFERVEPLPQLSGDAMLLTRPRHAAKVSEGPALLLQSSGTTAEPKIVRRDGASLDAVTRNTVRACGFTEADRVLAAVPLCHSYGLEHGILAPVSAGSCVHVCEKFDLPAVLQALGSAGITMFPGVPFMFDMLCRTHGIAFPDLRTVYSAGGPLPRATFDAFLAKFGRRVAQLYGATEIGSVTFNDPDRSNFDAAGVGMPMEGVSVRILDRDDPRIDAPLGTGEEGLVAIAAPSMLTGYLDGEPAPLVGGHFITGDIGRLSAEGALTITGRLKLLIDVGGRKVNPLEVEAVLNQHPDVGACVVVPMRLSDTVYRLKAVVTPARPDVELSVQDLRRFAQERLTPYKVPRVFEVRDRLPTSAAGKVIRRLVEAS